MRVSISFFVQDNFNSVSAGQPEPINMELKKVNSVMWLVGAIMELCKDAQEQDGK